MPFIFISYRRDDSADVARDIAEILVKTFGARNVFLDRNSIQEGDHFPDTIRDAIDSSDVMLVIMGKQWLTDRLYQPDDFVYLEVRRGLDRAGLRVIPVLLDGMRMPKATELPTDIADLVHRNAFLLATDRTQFSSGIQRLVTRIHKRRVAQSKRIVSGLLVLLTLLIVSAAVIYANRDTFFSFPTNTLTLTSAPTDTNSAPPTFTWTPTGTASATPKSTRTLTNTATETSTSTADLTETREMLNATLTESMLTVRAANEPGRGDDQDSITSSPPLPTSFIASPTPRSILPTSFIPSATSRPVTLPTSSIPTATTYPKRLNGVGSNIPMIND